MLNSVKYQGRGNKDLDGLYDLMMQYEHSAVEYFSDNTMEARSLTHPRAGDLKESVTNTTQQYKNPFLEAALWIRGEMLDIAGMLNALKGRELVAKRQQVCESKKRDDQDELEKLSQGKTTLKSFYKGAAAKEQDKLNLTQSLEQVNQDIEDFSKL